MVVLMGYASRHGSTRAIADRIAASLDEYGNLVEVHAIADAPDPGGYDAVVLGSGIYGGAWSQDAVRFVRRHVDALARRPVSMFSVGLGPAAADQGFRLAGLMERQGPKILGGFSGILRPRRAPRLRRRDPGRTPVPHPAAGLPGGPGSLRRLPGRQGTRRLGRRHRPRTRERLGSAPKMEGSL